MLYLNGSMKFDQLDDVEGYVDTEVADILSEVEIVESHLHSGSRYFGSTAGSAPAILTSLAPWSVIASADAATFGNAVEIFDGTENFDYPFTVAYFDPHQLFITSVGSDGTNWKLRFANSGWNGAAHTYANMAEAVAAHRYTELLVQVDNTKTDSLPIPFNGGRVRAGSKLWCQVMNNAGDSDDDSDAELTISFLIGCHAYAE